MANLQWKVREARVGAPANPANDPAALNISAPDATTAARDYFSARDKYHRPGVSQRLDVMKLPDRVSIDVATQVVVLGAAGKREMWVVQRVECFPDMPVS